MKFIITIDSTHFSFNHTWWISPFRLSNLCISFTGDLLHRLFQCNNFALTFLCIEWHNTNIKEFCMAIRSDVSCNPSWMKKAVVITSNPVICVPHIPITYLRRYPTLPLKWSLRSFLFRTIKVEFSYWKNIFNSWSIKN